MAKWSLHSVLAVFMLVIVSVGLHAQEQAQVYLNQLDFSRYPKVDLYVTLVDRERESIRLSERDTSVIRVWHKNTPVAPNDLQSVIELKEKGESELYLALVFDNSTSMQGRMPLLEAAAKQFVDSLKIGDYVTLIDFGDGRISTTIPEIPRPVYARARTPFSNSKPFLHRNISSAIMTDRTFMYDALAFALSTLNTANVLGRKAVILFSDGEDNASAANASQVQKIIRTYDIPVYGIDLNTVENRTLKEIATSSGGEYFFVRQVSDLGTLYQTVLKLLRSQYRVTYRSPEQTVSGDAYPVIFRLDDRYAGQSQRVFAVDGENVGFYNLVYLESIGQESLRNYLEYLTNFASTKHGDNVRLKIGRYWQTRGEYGKALAVYNMVLRNPASKHYNEALLEKGDLYKAARQFKAAQEAYNQVLQSEVGGSVRARALLELAKSYTAEGNFSMALSTYSSLSSQYEGTELASEAFLQSATLSMEMGDLPSAAKSLEQVVTNYAESKSAVYARIELAKLAEQEGKTEEAVGYYRDAIDSNIDSDIKEDLTLRLGNLLFLSGKIGEAVELYRGLLDGGASLSAVYAAQQELVPALLSDGRISEARLLFEQMTPSARTELLATHEGIPFLVGGTSGTVLPNGAFVMQSSPPGGDSPLSMIEWPEAEGKFAVVGPIYSLAGSSSPTTVSLPTEAAWRMSGLIRPGVSGVYHFTGGTWEAVTMELDAQSQAYQFPYTRPGIYAILASAPRVIRLYNVYFDLGKATIRKEAERNLYEIIDDLKALPDIRLEIAGHTDSTGREEENIDLSSRRAQSIKDFMILNGISADRLVARGYGSQYPLAPNDTPENLQKNRRSEFTVISTIGDPVRKTTGEVVRYTVFLRAFRSVKDAYEEKKKYQGRDFPVSIVTNEGTTGQRYELTLGTYETEEEARDVAERFREEFRGLELQILTTRRSR